MGFWYTILFFLKRLFFSKDVIITVIIPKIDSKIYLRNKTYDIHTFHQIFIDEELNINYPFEVKNIIDCGSNIGLSAIYLKKLFPSSRLICVEPAKDNLEILKLNLSSYSDILILETAVYSHNCELYLVDIGKGNSSYQVVENPMSHEIMSKMKCTGISEIVNLFENVDILKIDIEGSEYQCFLDTDLRWFSKAKTILVEIHNDIYANLEEKIMNVIPSNTVINKSGEYTIFQN